MRRILTLSMVLGLLLAAVATAPVAAGSRQVVTMTVTTTFDSDPDAFTATGIPGCDTGLVYDGGAHVQFTRTHGVFAGYKVFDCGSESGFVVRLNAMFGDGGSVGTWSIVGTWGSAAGMSGAGKLTGEGFTGGILDIYVGTVTL